MLKDLKGQTFGRLTVIERDFSKTRKNKCAYWLCECSCGNNHIVSSQSLLRTKNPTKSCGCIRTENNQKSKGIPKEKVNMIGKKFGRLLVEKESKKRSGRRKKLMYDCLCDCGNKHTVSGEVLRSGSVKSCGCLYDETRQTIAKKYCDYDMESYTYGVGYCSNNTKFFFDKEDYDKIKDYSWWYDGRYVCAHRLKNDNYTTAIVRLHRVVLDIKDREDINIDHINCIRHDCRKSNLRKSTDEENARNKIETFATENNPVGILSLDNGKYSVFICKKYKGTYDTFKEAFTKRKELEELTFGEFQYNPEASKVIEFI